MTTKTVVRKNPYVFSCFLDNDVFGFDSVSIFFFSVVGFYFRDFDVSPMRFFTFVTECCGKCPRLSQKLEHTKKIDGKVLPADS